ERGAASADPTSGAVGAGLLPARPSVRVDLRLLELARKVHVDGLPLREDVEAGDPRLAVAVARILDAAEGQVHLGADRRRVDVEDAGLELVHGPERRVDVLGVD